MNLDHIEWLKKHMAFMAKDVSRHGIPGVTLPIRALKAIDAGGPDGVPMGAVHKALMSARLSPGVIRLITERLEEDGHITRRVFQTGGRPRVQMWSFRHVLDNPLFDGDVAEDMSNNGGRGGRGTHAGKVRKRIFQEVIKAATGDLSIKDIEVGAYQIYSDIENNQAFRRMLWDGNDKKQMTALLCSMTMSGYLGNAGETAGVRRWFMGVKEFPVW